jgi:hypothetical protein
MKSYHLFLIFFFTLKPIWADSNHFVLDFETTKILLKKDQSLLELRAKAVINPSDIDSAFRTDRTHRIQWTLNPIYQYRLSDLVTTGICYVYKGQGVFEEDPSQEHRFCQDLILKFGARPSTISHRLRLEERFISESSASSWYYRTRLRYRLTHRQMIGEEGTHQQWGLNFYDEVFFGLTGSQQLVQANWLHMGVLFEYEDDRDFEIGATLETSAKPGALEIQNLLLLQMEWTW